MTTPKAINDIVTALGGESSADKTVPALKAVYAALGGGGVFPDTIPEALEKIASVAEPPVPEPTGAISITANGNDIDVAQYATANVNVPASAVVSGTKSITENGDNIDVTNYAAVNVNVAQLTTDIPQIGLVAVMTTTTDKLYVINKININAMQSGNKRVSETTQEVIHMTSFQIGAPAVYNSDFGKLAEKKEVYFIVASEEGVTNKTLTIEDANENKKVITSWTADNRKYWLLYIYTSSTYTGNYRLLYS